MCSWNGALAFALLSPLAWACGEPRAAAPAAIEVPSPPAISATVARSVSSIPVASDSAPTATGQERYDHSVVLHPGDGPCVVRFTAEAVDTRSPEQVLLSNVLKIETVKSPGCAAGVFYQTQNADHGAWTGGYLPKPGHESDPGFADSPLHFVDLDHDGYLDIDFLIIQTQYIDEHPQFSFDPRARLFR